MASALTAQKAFLNSSENVVNRREDFDRGDESSEAQLKNEIATLMPIKPQKSEKKSTQDPVRRKMDDNKHSPDPTKVKKMGAQMQVSENSKNKQAFGKTSESESTLTKMIKENYCLRHEKKITRTQNSSRQCESGDTCATRQQQR